MAKIRLQRRARLTKKTEHEIHAAEVTDFATPAPEDPSHSVQLLENPSVPSPENASIAETTSRASSSTSVSSIFSTAVAATMDDSNLSPCTSDNKGTATVPSTSATTSIPALAPSSHLCTDPVELKKKGHVPATKKPRRRGWQEVGWILIARHCSLFLSGALHCSPLLSAALCCFPLLSITFRCSPALSIALHCSAALRVCHLSSLSSLSIIL